MPVYPNNNLFYESGGCIDILNKSNYSIYIKMSSFQNTDNYFKELLPGHSMRWQRNKGTLFHIQLERSRTVKNGPIYEVNLGENYYINQNYNLISFNTNREIGLSSVNFGEGLLDEDNNNLNNKDCNILNEINSKQEENCVMEKIIFNNFSKSPIKIRFTDDFGKLIFVLMNSSEYVSKSKGRYMIEIIDEINFIFKKFYVYSNESYTYNGRGNFVSDNFKILMDPTVNIFNNSHNIQVNIDPLIEENGKYIKIYFTLK